MIKSLKRTHDFKDVKTTETEDKKLKLDASVSTQELIDLSTLSQDISVYWKEIQDADSTVAGCRKLLAAIDGYTSGTLAWDGAEEFLSYASRTGVELLFRFASSVDKNDTVVLLNVLERLISRVADDLGEHRDMMCGVVGSFVSSGVARGDEEAKPTEFTTCIRTLLYTSGQVGSVLIDSVLRLLTSFVMLSSETALCVLNSFDLSTQTVLKFWDWHSTKEIWSVRIRFMYFVLSFLVIDDARVTAELLKIPDLLTNGFIGLIYDHASHVVNFLKIIREKIVEKRKILAVVKRYVFNPIVLKSLSLLLSWSGRSKWQGLAKFTNILFAKWKNKKSFTSRFDSLKKGTDDDPASGEVQEATRALLYDLFCNYRIGLVVPEASSGFPASNLNPKLTTVLEELLHPFSHSISRNFVIDVLLTSHGQIEYFFRGLMSAHDIDRSTTTAYGYRMLALLVERTDTVEMLRVASRQVTADLQTVALNGDYDSAFATSAVCEHLLDVYRYRMAMKWLPAFDEVFFSWNWYHFSAAFKFIAALLVKFAETFEMKSSIPGLLPVTFGLLKKRLQIELLDAIPSIEQLSSLVIAEQKHKVMGIPDDLYVDKLTLITDILQMLSMAASCSEHNLEMRATAMLEYVDVILSEYQDGDDISPELVERAALLRVTALEVALKCSPKLEALSNQATIFIDQFISLFERISTEQLRSVFYQMVRNVTSLQAAKKCEIDAWWRHLSTADVDERERFARFFKTLVVTQKITDAASDDEQDKDATWFEWSLLTDALLCLDHSFSPGEVTLLRDILFVLQEPKAFQERILTFHSWKNIKKSLAILSVLDVSLHYNGGFSEEDALDDAFMFVDKRRLKRQLTEAFTECVASQGHDEVFKVTAQATFYLRICLFYAEKYGSLVKTLTKVIADALDTNVSVASTVLTLCDWTQFCISESALGSKERNAIAQLIVLSVRRVFRLEQSENVPEDVVKIGSAMKNSVKSYIISCGDSAFVDLYVDTFWDVMEISERDEALRNCYLSKNVEEVSRILRKMCSVDADWSTRFGSPAPVICASQSAMFLEMLEVVDNQSDLYALDADFLRQLLTDADLQPIRDDVVNFITHSWKRLALINEDTLFSVIGAPVTCVRLATRVRFDRNAALYDELLRRLVVDTTIKTNDLLHYAALLVPDLKTVDVNQEPYSAFFAHARKKTLKLIEKCKQLENGEHLTTFIDYCFFVDAFGLDDCSAILKFAKEQESLDVKIQLLITIIRGVRDPQKFADVQNNALRVLLSCSELSVYAASIGDAISKIEPRTLADALGRIECATLLKDFIRRAFESEDEVDLLLIVTAVYLKCDKFMNKTFLPSEAFQLIWQQTGVASFLFTSKLTGIKAHKKELIVDVWYALARANPLLVCTTEHIPVLLSAYTASMSRVDRKIFGLLYLYECSGGTSLEAYRPFVWGKTAIAKYGIDMEKLNEGDFSFLKTSVISTTSEVMNCFDAERLRRTAAAFPVQLPLVSEWNDVRTEELSYKAAVKLQGAGQSEMGVETKPEAEKKASDVYDARFVLMATYHLLNTESNVNMAIFPCGLAFIRSPYFAVCVTSLCSEDVVVRALGRSILALTYGFMEQEYCSKEQKRHRLATSKPPWLRDIKASSATSFSPVDLPVCSFWLHVVAELVNLPDEPIPTILAAHVIKTANSVIIRQESFMFPELVKFYSAKANFDVKHVPSFVRLLTSHTDTGASRRKWMFDFLRSNIKTNLDLEVCMNTSVFELLMAFGSAPFADKSPVLDTIVIMENATKHVGSNAAFRFVHECGVLQWLLVVLQRLNWCKYIYVELYKRILSLVSEFTSNKKNKM